ncbi:MAG: insulinase family protein [Deltaproteobacteria bacterium]|nr:insulinase family protein [Deltaproteobacteria bacterium]
MLPNGVQVILVPVNTKTTIVRTRVSRGFADELMNTNPGLNEAGITHLLEHLLFLGTKSFPELDNELKKNAIRTNANTDWDETNYYEIGSPKTLETMLKTQASMLGEPLLRDNDIKNETRPVTEELQMRSVNPYVELIWLSLAVHARQRGEHLMAGEVHEVRATSPETVRNVYKRLYSADNMTLVVIGGMEDPAATQAMVEAEYGKIPKHAGPPPNSMQEEFMPKPGETPKLVKIKSEIPGRRLLNIQFPIANTGKTEHAAILLKRFLNRQGAGSPLAELYAQGLVTKVQTDVDTYRDQTFLRLIVDLTMKGEVKVNEVLEGVSSVFGTIAAKGLPETVLNEMKLSYATTHASGSGLMEVAEELSKAAEKYGLDNLDAHPKLVLSVTGEEVKELASRLTPEAAQPTMVTPNAKGTLNPFIKRQVEIVDLAPQLPRMQQAFAEAKAAIPTPPNPFLLGGRQKFIGDKKSVAIIVAPGKDDSKAEAMIEFTFSKGLSAEEKLGLDMALQAFRLEPANALLFSQLDEAGIELDFKFNPSTMTMSVSASGEAAGAQEALFRVLAALRKYEPKAATFENAKGQFIKRIEDLPSTDVSRQALIIGFNQLMGQNTVDLSSRIESAKKIDFELAKAGFAKSQASWAVKGVLAGNWNDAALRQTVPLMLPKAGEPLPKPTVHDEKLADAKYPELMGRVVPVDRQGVARLYPVAVKQYSEEYWAFQIFSQMLSKRLMEVVRTEMGLVYAVQGGFDVLPSGGAVLYMVGDTSHNAFKVALGFTATLHDMLYTDKLTDADFKSSISETVQGINKQLNGAKGRFSALFDQMDPKDTALKLKGMSLTKVLDIVRAKLESSPQKLDAVAVGKGDPVCENLLTKP